MAGLAEARGPLSLERSVDLLKAAWYMVAIEGQGNFTMIFGNQTNASSCAVPGFCYGGPFQAGPGAIPLRIIPGNGSLIDSAVVYETENGSADDHLFDPAPSPARVLNYTRISATRWRLGIDAEKPFLLSFAESYNPLWEARVFRNGSLIARYRPITLYETINGFWINETGQDLDVEIVYLPQEPFDSLMVVPPLTIAAIIAYLAYSAYSSARRRGKQDGGAA